MYECVGVFMCVYEFIYLETRFHYVARLYLLSSASQILEL
jgi:hypothetical protein